MIDKKNPIPLYIQLTDHIKNLIDTGSLSQGEQIPTETMWMNEFSLGRATVRAALAELERKGVIYKLRGIGTFVSKKQTSLALIPLISFTYPLQALGLNIQNNIVKKEKIMPSRELMKTMRCTVKNERWHCLRIRYVKDSAIAIEKSYFSTSSFEKIKEFDLTGSHAQILIKDAGISLKKIDQSIISRLPTKEEQETLNLSNEQMVLELTRWMYEESEKDPFSYVEFVIPQDLLLDI